MVSVNQLFQVLLVLTFAIEWNIFRAFRFLIAGVSHQLARAVLVATRLEREPVGHLIEPFAENVMRNTFHTVCSTFNEPFDWCSESLGKHLGNPA